MSMPDHVPSLLRHPSFVMFWCARTSTNGAFQMLAVAVGWQLYDLTNNPLDLGIVGLVQFVPLVLALGLRRAGGGSLRPARGDRRHPGRQGACRDCAGARVAQRLAHARADLRDHVS